MGLSQKTCRAEHEKVLASDGTCVLLQTFFFDRGPGGVRSFGIECRKNFFVNENHRQCRWFQKALAMEKKNSSFGKVRAVCQPPSQTKGGSSPDET